MIRVACPVLAGNEREYVNEALENNQLSNGPFVKRFEASFADYIGVKHALAVSNGTTALHTTMVALGIQPGDEVIVPVFTYIATANAVKYCGATPVFVDVDHHWNLSPIEFEKKITAKTKVVIPVHLYGCPVEMDDVLDIASDNGIQVIEDAAESLGSSYKGKMTGSIGLAGTFSLYPNKLITSGEGGVITTNDEKFYDEMFLLRGQGVDRNRRYYHTRVGYNYRMTELQAAVGLAQIEKLWWHISRRIEVFEWYYKRLIGNNKIEFQPGVISNREFLRWMVCIEFSEGIDRDFVVKKLEDNEIETRITFPLITWMSMYKSEERFPVAERIAKNGICLPTHSNLTEDDVEYICNKLIEILSKI